MDLSSQSTWQKFNPDFHIEDAAFWAQSEALTCDDFADLEPAMIEEGYIHCPNIYKVVNHQKYAEHIKSLAKQNILPVFSFIYDEFWLMQLHFKNYLSKFLGDEYKLLPAFWAWRVGAGGDEAGWSPHRDRDYQAIDDDGKPLALTLWIPLTEANPVNGCIYLVPADRDKAYGTPQDMNYDFDYASIRALPAQPGDALIWNHSILHWGAKAAKRAKHERISVAFEFQRGDIAAMKDMQLEPGHMPSFDERLDLIAKQIVQYLHMYEFDQATIEFAKSRMKK